MYSVLKHVEITENCVFLDYITTEVGRSVVLLHQTQQQSASKAEPKCPVSYSSGTYTFAQRSNQRNDETLTATNNTLSS